MTSKTAGGPTSPTAKTAPDDDGDKFEGQEGTRRKCSMLVSVDAMAPTNKMSMAAKKIQTVFRGFNIRKQKQLTVKMELESELESVKAASMYKLVENVKVNVLDTIVEVNCLYMTNKQAAQVTVEKMAKVREQLDIKDPKMVIRLMPCHFGASYQITFPHFCDGEGGGRFPQKDIPEVSALEREQAEHQLVLLVKDVLLPLARETRSLVIGSESCALTAAFVKVSASMQRQLGEECPFRLLILAKAQYYDLSSKDPRKVAFHVKKACPAWKQAKPQEHVLRALYGEDKAYWPREDLPTGSYSLVVFECLDNNDKYAIQTSNKFSNDLISFLSQDLPVIALQTYGTNKMVTMPALADHVTRGMPLMLLDSRQREVKNNLDLAIHAQKRLAEDLHEGGHQWAGRCDQYFTSAMAYLKLCLDQDSNTEKRRMSRGPARPQSPGAGADVEVSAKKDQDMWLWQAIEDRLEDSVGEGSDNADLRPLAKAADRRRARVMQATDFLMEYVGGELEWESKELQRDCAAAIDKVENASSWAALAACLKDKDVWCKIRGCCFHQFDQARKFADKNKWIRVEEKRMSIMGSLVMNVVIEETPNFDFHEAKEQLVAMLRESFNSSVAYDAKVKTKKAYRSNQDMWVSVYDIFNATNVHTGNIHNLKQVSGILDWILFNLAQIDRLPRKSTLEALVLMRTAWTIVDIYNKSARRYKLYTRMTHFCLLLLGVATVAVSVLCQRYPSMMGEKESHAVLLAIALTGSFLTGFAALVDPHRKWIQLRNGAYSLEAEIWKFRARVRPYAGTATSNTIHGRLISERRAEQLLQQAVVSIQGRVRLSTGLKETSFYSMTVTTDNLDPPAPNIAHLDDDDDGLSASQLTRPMSSRPKVVSMLPQQHVDPRQIERLSAANLKGVHFKHQQFKGPGAERQSFGPNQDSYHAPAKPEEYIKWRLVPKMEFYKARIPKYARLRRVCQVLLLVTALATSLLAFLNMTSWTAIVAAFTSALASFQEFLDVARKLQRYSTIANRLASILVWWQALDKVDKADMKNVNHLVEETEGLLNGELNAWIGTELRSRLRLDKTEQKEDGKEGKKQKA